jgi:hypothetical protein
MLKSIINYFKNRNNPEIEKQDYEIEVAFSITDLVIFVIIVFLIFKFV